MRNRSKCFSARNEEDKKALKEGPENLKLIVCSSFVTSAYKFLSFLKEANMQWENGEDLITIAVVQIIISYGDEINK